MKKNISLIAAFLIALAAVSVTLAEENKKASDLEAKYASDILILAKKRPSDL